MASDRPDKFKDRVDRYHGYFAEAARLHDVNIEFSEAAVGTVFDRYHLALNTQRLVRNERDAGYVLGQIIYSVLDGEDNPLPPPRDGGTERDRRDNWELAKRAIALHVAAQEMRFARAHVSWRATEQLKDTIGFCELRCGEQECVVDLYNQISKRLFVKGGARTKLNAKEQITAKTPIKEIVEQFVAETRTFACKRYRDREK